MKLSSQTIMFVLLQVSTNTYNLSQNKKTKKHTKKGKEIKSPLALKSMMNSHCKAKRAIFPSLKWGGGGGVGEKGGLNFPFELPKISSVALREMTCL